MTSRVTTFRQSQVAFSLIALSALGMAGCSKGPVLGSVQGVVRQGGQPVPFAYLVFQPQQRGTYGAAYTDAQGRYTLQFSRTRQGALVGRHNVTIRTAGLDEVQVEDKSTGQMITPPLPDGYQPRLEVQFEREVQRGRNTFDFDLASADAARS